jgi:hypothetical protein
MGFSTTLPDVFTFGVLPGTILGPINYYFFFGYRYGPLHAPTHQEPEHCLRLVPASLEIGITKELIYRLFFLSRILYTVKYLHRRWRLEERSFSGAGSRRRTHWCWR